MTAVALLGRTKLRIMGRYLADVRREPRLKVFVITAFTVCFWSGLYWMFGRGFQFVAREVPAIAPLMTARVLALFFLTLLSLLSFSNILVGFSTLYQAREMEWLFNQPVESATVFLVRYWEALGFSSWASFVLGLPLLIAYGRVFEVHPAYYLGIPIFFVPFIVVAGAAGVALTLCIVRLFPRLRLRWLLGGLAAGFITLLVFLFRSFRLTRINQLEVVDQILAVLGRTQSPLFPSHWINEGLLALGGAQWREAGFYFCLLLSYALMAVLVLYYLARWLYAPGWHGLKGWGLVRVYRAGGAVIGRLEPLFNVFPRATRALLLKDIRQFWRDPGQWAQVTLVFGLLMVYVANLGNVDRYTDFRWQNRIAFLNLGTTALVLSVLTTRFIFPLFSLEGRRFWIVGLAPVTRAHLVREKFLLCLLTTLGFSEALMLVSCNALGTTPLVTMISCYTILCLNVGLAGLAAGLGGLYPNFREDNPARIVSGFGGTMNFLCAIAFIGAVVLIQGTVYFFYSEIAQSPVPQMTTTYRGVSFAVALAGAMGAVTLLSALATFVPLHLGVRHATALEF